LDGTALRDYIHPDDVVTVIIKLLENGGNTPYLMNVGSGDGKTVLEIVEKAREISGVDFVTTLSPSRPGDIPSITANIFEVSKLLGSIQKTTSLNTLLDFLKHS
jgi:UDP-glucose 4-epimerase